MKGTIGFFADSKSWKSRLICWLTKSQFSHTFIILGDLEKHILIIDSDRYSVEVKEITDFLKSKKHKLKIYQPINVSYDIVQQGLNKCYSFIGRIYGYPQLLGYILMRLFNALGLKIKRNPIRFGIICSELVWTYCNTLFPEQFQQLDKNSITPEDLLNVIENSKNFKEIELVLDNK